MGEYKYVLYEKDDRVAIITLNRPERKNAMGPEMRESLFAALEEAEQDEGVRAIIVTGAGGSWSAGADLKGDSIGTGPSKSAAKGEGAETLEEWVTWKRQVFLDQMWMRNLSKPIIAAVRGYCLGAAFEWCLNMDMIIAAESARFGTPESRHVSQQTRLPFVVGLQMAKKILLTGDMITGREAERIGLVMECVPDDELMEVALRLARRISMNSPQMILFIKGMVDSIADAMGWMNALAHAGLWDAMGHGIAHQPQVESSGIFQAREEKGTKGFIAARDALYPPEGVPYGMVHK